MNRPLTVKFNEVISKSLFDVTRKLMPESINEDFIKCFYTTATQNLIEAFCELNINRTSSDCQFSNLEIKVHGVTVVGYTQSGLIEILAPSLPRSECIAGSVYYTAMNKLIKLIIELREVLSLWDPRDGKLISLFMRFQVGDDINLFINDKLNRIY